MTTSKTNPHKFSPTTSWTAENVEALRDLWAKGYSAGYIADAIPGFSRNAILGKIDRLNLTRDRGPRKAANDRPSRAPGVVQPSRQPGAVRHNVPRLQAKANNHDPGAEALPVEPPSDGCGISLFDLTNSTCRWPKGVPGHVDFCFCGRSGADMIADKPYCVEHTRLARRVA